MTTLELTADGTIGVKPHTYLAEKIIKLLPQVDPELIWEFTEVEPLRFRYLVAMCFGKHADVLQQEIEQFRIKKEIV